MHLGFGVGLKGLLPQIWMIDSRRLGALQKFITTTHHDQRKYIAFKRGEWGRLRETGENDLKEERKKKNLKLGFFSSLKVINERKLVYGYLGSCLDLFQATDKLEVDVWIDWI